jgi:hypothetical protein
MLFSVPQVKATDELIRSERMCRLDLRRYGCKFDKNSQKPYWLGHERPDVIEARNEFVKTFLTNKDHYYLVADGNDPQWVTPKRNPTILLCMFNVRLVSANSFFFSCSPVVHDESCFRSGETTARRWFFTEETTRFFNKGKGRSLMLSDFLVSCPESPFFELSKEEWAAAVKRHRDLLDDSTMQYLPRSASASIRVGVDGYFDNDAVLEQFTRLFKLLPFKKAYEGHKMNIVVDNARTHSAREYSLNEFGKGIGTRCPVKSIQYLDGKGNKNKIECYFKGGENDGKSKGLLILARELKLKIPDSILLPELKQLLEQHKAFQNVRRLFFLSPLFAVFYCCHFLLRIFSGVAP